MVNDIKRIGEITSSDLHLIQRVNKRLEEARIAQEIVQAHLAEEYGLTPGQAITFAGEIVEPTEAPLTP